MNDHNNTRLSIIAVYPDVIGDGESGRTEHREEVKVKPKPKGTRDLLDLPHKRLCPLALWRDDDD